MRLQKSLFWIHILGFGIAYNSTAQNKTINTDPIKVVKAYEPKLADAEKVTSKAEISPEAPEKPTLKYGSLNRPLQISFNPTPLTPLKASLEALPTLDQSYLRAGLGNYSTPLLNLHYMSGRSNNLEYSFDVKHLSSKGAFKIDSTQYKSVNTGLNNVDAAGKYYFGKHAADAGFSYNRNVINFYGLNQDTFKVPTIDIQQRYSQIKFHAGIESFHTESGTVNYAAKINYYNLSDLLNQTESNFRIDGRAYGNYNGSKFELLTAFDYTSYNSPLDKSSLGLINLNRTLLYINPRYTYTTDLLSLEGGLNTALESLPTGSNFHVYPHIMAEYKIFEGMLTGFAGITGNLQRNAWNSIIQRNPFLNLNLDIRNTNNQVRLLGGIKGAFDEQTNYIIQVDYRNSNNEIFYVNNLKDQTKIDLIYDKVNVLNLSFDASHSLNNKLLAGLKFNYANYTMTTLDQPWMTPTLTGKLDVKYTMQDKLIASAGIVSYNGVKYLKSDGTNHTLSGIVDLNLGLEYRYTNRISGFLTLNNLASTRYMRYYNYPSYGFNLIGGVTLGL